MTKELQQLSSIIKIMLEQLSPVLSGNMQKEIGTAQIVKIGDNEITFCISAPFYDQKKWKEDKVIVHTKTQYGSITDYAEWVNRLGAFGTKNKSMFWVNRAVNEAARTIPDAEIINKLEL